MLSSEVLDYICRIHGITASTLDNFTAVIQAF